MKITACNDKTDSIDLSDQDQGEQENPLRLNYNLYTLLSEKEYFKGELTLSHVYYSAKTRDKSLYVSTEEDSLFYKVPKYILSFIDGCPSRISPMTIEFDEENDRLKFCATQKVED